MAARPVAVLLLLAALALAGCSGKGDGGSAPPTTSASAEPTPTPSPSSASSSSASPSPSGPAPLSGEVQRDVKDNSFPDGTFTVKVGTKVTWTHRGSNPHSVSGDGFDSNPNCSTATSALPGNCMKGGDAFSHTFDTAGSFSYRCRIHGSMTGTVTVVA